MNRFFGSLLALALAWSLACRSPSGPLGPSGLRAGAARGKNLLVVTLDTTRADRLGCYGGDPRTTPHLDALAERGVRFAKARSAGSPKGVLPPRPSHSSARLGPRPRKTLVSRRT